MIQRVVGLVCQKLKLVSVSFAKLQFLDRKKKAWLHALKILQWVHSSGLKGFVARAISRRKLKSNRANLTRVAVEKSQTGPESKRGWFTQIFQRT